MNVRKFVLAEIDKNPFQVRSGVDPVYVEELAEDIERNGLLQTPVGRLVDDGVQLAFGHNRLEAFRLLAERFSEFEEMPVDVRELSDEQMAMMAWSENEVRQQLNPVERVRALDRMIAAFGWTQQEAGDRLGMARSTVANMLRLLKLPGHVLKGLEMGQLSVRQATALLPVYELEQEDQDRIWKDPIRSSYLMKALSGEMDSDSIRQLVSNYLDMLERSKERAAAKEVVSFPLIPSPSPRGGRENKVEDDPEKDKLRMLLTPAMDYARTQQYISVSQLQRELRVSWRTAHDLVQEMRKWDVIGDMDGSSMRYQVKVGKYAQEVEPRIVGSKTIRDDPLIDDGPAEEEDVGAGVVSEAPGDVLEEDAGGLIKDQPLHEAEEKLVVDITWKRGKVEVGVTIHHGDGTMNSVMRTIMGSLPIRQVDLVLDDVIPMMWREVIG